MELTFYKLWLLCSYALGVALGTLSGCLIQGSLWMENYFACAILGPFFQPQALFMVWFESGLILEKTAMALGIVLLVASFSVARKTARKQHVLWGIFAYAFMISIYTAFCVVCWIV